MSIEVGFGLSVLSNLIGYWALGFNWVLVIGFGWARLLG